MKAWLAAAALALVGAIGSFGCGDGVHPAGSAATGAGAASGAGGPGVGGGGTAASGTGGTGQGGGGGGAPVVGGAGGAVAGGGPLGGAGPSDAGPDVSFYYDAAPHDAGVNEDTACVASQVDAEKLPVDIIWTVDQSGSMGDEIAQVKANINGSFASILGASGLDYRVVMIASKGTTGTNVCVAAPLGAGPPGCGDNLPLFRAVGQHIESWDSLQLILSTYDNPSPSLRWDNFLRYDATKVFIEVTDDDSVYLPGPVFDTQLLAKTPVGMFGTASNRKYKFHSIVGVHETLPPPAKCATAVNDGPQYQFLSNLTGGMKFPVCASDYSPIFNDIAQGIVGTLACEFKMPSDADAGAVDPNKVSVKYVPANGPEQIFPRVTDASQCSGHGWYYDDNAAPAKLILCPDACTKVKAEQGGKIQILLGCASG